MKNPFFQDPSARRQKKKQEMFNAFDATELYCPRCARSMPVKKRLLLVLPEGEKYEYICEYCATSVGTKTDKDAEQERILF